MQMNASLKLVEKVMDTLNRVKAIFARYNLTDANGRINSAKTIVTSTSLVFGLVAFAPFLHGLLF